jgi:hypothetical protein
MPCWTKGVYPTEIESPMRRTRGSGWAGWAWADEARRMRRRSEAKATNFGRKAVEGWGGAAFEGGCTVVERAFRGMGFMRMGGG